MECQPLLQMVGEGFYKVRLKGDEEFAKWRREKDHAQ